MLERIMRLRPNNNFLSNSMAKFSETQLNQLRELLGIKVDTQSENTQHELCKTTPEIMQDGVEEWIKSINDCIRAIKNIKSSIDAPYFNQTQQNAITQSVIQLKTTLDDPVLHTKRFIP
jgi:hypothetical protein